MSSYDVGVYLPFADQPVPTKYNTRARELVMKNLINTPTPSAKQAEEACMATQRQRAHDFKQQRDEMNVLRKRISSINYSQRPVTSSPISGTVRPNASAWSSSGYFLPLPSPSPLMPVSAGYKRPREEAGADFPSQPSRGPTPSPPSTQAGMPSEALYFESLVTQKIATSTYMEYASPLWEVEQELRTMQMVLRSAVQWRCRAEEITALRTLEQRVHREVEVGCRRRAAQLRGKIEAMEEALRHGADHVSRPAKSATRSPGSFTALLLADM